MPSALITDGFLACSKLPKKRVEPKIEQGIQGTEEASRLTCEDRVDGADPFPI